MISLIMPAFNEEKNIHNAISSILEQDYRDFELIIINDGSTDKTGEIVNEFLNNYGNIISFYSLGKIGKNAAFNFAVSKAKGDWFYFMGADDILPKNALLLWAKYTETLDSSDLVAIQARLEVISKNKKYNGLILPKNISVDNWSGPITMMSKGIIKEIVPVPLSYPNEDTWWSLYIRFFASQTLKVNDIVVLYRIHDGNAISRSSSFLKFNYEYHRRMKIKELFIEENKNRMKDSDILVLREEIRLENFRYTGNYLRIIFKRNSYIKDKTRALFLSSKYLYYIKKKLDRFMLGH